MNRWLPARLVFISRAASLHAQFSMGSQQFQNPDALFQRSDVVIFFFHPHFNLPCPFVTHRKTRVSLNDTYLSHESGVCQA